MKTEEKSIKDYVREKYGEIASQSKDQNASSCCGSGCCSTVDYEIFTEDYSKLGGYNPEADLGLGCGIPTEFAQISEGDTVIDLGSGAGNDIFVARAIAGEKGRLIGVDMTPAMIDKARINCEKLGYNNVEFRLGDIEKLPVSANIADVIVSNCVLNLVPDKEKAFSEMFRVLKPGGHFSVSDIVLKGDLPKEIQTAAEMYAGCVAGAIQKEAYLEGIRKAGFEDVEIKKEKLIQLPDDILATYLSAEEIKKFRESGTGILSVTVYGTKPERCCEEGCC